MDSREVHEGTILMAYPCSPVSNMLARSTHCRILVQPVAFKKGPFPYNIIIVMINTLFYEGSILSYHNKYNKLIYNMAF